jgi:hypothetical protein
MWLVGMLDSNIILQSSAWYPLHSGFLLGLLFNPEDGSNIFHQNMG